MSSSYLNIQILNNKDQLFGFTDRVDFLTEEYIKSYIPTKYKLEYLKQNAENLIPIYTQTYKKWGSDIVQEQTYIHLKDELLGLLVKINTKTMHALHNDPNKHHSNYHDFINRILDINKSNFHLVSLSDMEDGDYEIIINLNDNTFDCYSYHYDDSGSTLNATLEYSINLNEYKYIEDNDNPSIIAMLNNETNILLNKVIISGFPGIGKSTCINLLGEEYKGIKFYDVDSSSFSWIIDESGNKIRNPNFINDYINHIKSIGNNENSIIFTSSHSDVIDALVDNKLEFVLIYPDENRKEEFMDIYRIREYLGHPLSVNIAMVRWDNWIKSCYDRECTKIELGKDQFLADYLKNIINIQKTN